MFLRVGDEEVPLSRSDASDLRDRLTAALTERRTFLRTVGAHRADGSYEVSRRHADSTGHSKVFDRFGDLEQLYERLPDRFTAEDVGRAGLTGGRRHVLLYHLAEHPQFDCTLVSRQPLTVEKVTRPEDGAEGETPAD